MWYVMSEQELRQPEPLEAALVMALGEVETMKEVKG